MGYDDHVDDFYSSSSWFDEEEPIECWENPYLICSRCGSEVGETEKKCEECGKELDI